MRVRTLPQLFQRAVHEHGPHAAVRYERDGDWHPITYAQLGRRVEQVTAGLLAGGLQPGDRVLLAAEAGPRRLIVDLARVHAGALSLSLTPDGGSRGLATPPDGETIDVLVVDDRPLEPPLADLAGETATGPEVLLLGSEGREDGAAGTEEPEHHLTLDELVREGQRVLGDGQVNVEERWRSLGSEDPARLAFPDRGEEGGLGVAVPHRHVTETVRSIASTMDLDPGDRCLCVACEDAGVERLALLAALHQGAEAWVPGSGGEPTRPVGQAHPELLVAGPPAFEALKREIEERLEASDATQRRLFAWARSLGEQRTQARRDGGPGLGLRLRHVLADRLVLAQVRAVLGLGALEAALVAGEGLAPDLESWLRAVGVPLKASYARPEAGGLLALERESHRGPHSVGRPLAHADVRIDADEGAGEIQVRSPAGNGWRSTGDVGHVDEDGILHVEERRTASARHPPRG